MLRRLPAVFLALFCAAGLLCACSPQEKAPEKPVTTGFSCDVDMSYQDMQISGRLIRESAGTLTLEFTEPASLDGLSMQWDGETITMKAGALSFGVDPAAIPESALGKGLLDALDAGYRSQEEGELTDQGLSTTGQSVNGDFEILSDPATGSLLSLEIPKLHVTASFSNFQLTDGAS